MRLKTTCSICFAFAGTLLGQQHPRPIPEIKAILETTTIGRGRASLPSTKVAVVFRDTLGRTRLEEGDRVTINDPTARTVSVIDINAKIVHQLTQASQSAQAASSSGFPRPVMTGTNLGTQVIDGYQVSGRRQTVRLPPASLGNLLWIEYTSEKWVSDKLGLAILTHTVDSVNGEETQRYRNILENIPLEKSLFEIPAGFSVVKGVAPPRRAQ